MPREFPAGNRLTPNSNSPTPSSRIAGQWRLFAGHVTKVPPEGQRIADETSITQAELIRRTQELYDSIVPGNSEPWKKYFAEDCIFADEKDRIMDKAKLVADITPMPAGYSGSIKIENPKSVIGSETRRS